MGIQKHAVMRTISRWNCTSTGPCVEANTMGAYYLGAMGSAILFGITNLQVYSYALRYPNDSLTQKVTVAILWLIDAVHLALATHVVYYYLVQFFGVEITNVPVVWTFKLKIPVTLFGITFVQTLYAIRVWRLSRGFYYRFLPYIIIAIVAVGGTAVGLATVILLFRADQFVEYQESRFGRMFYIFFGYTTFIDIFITTCMCWCLRVGLSEFSRTKSIIVKIIRYVVTTGATTCACSLAILITYATLPNTLVFLAFELLLARIYILSYMTMLNTRVAPNSRDDSAIASTRDRDRPFAINVTTHSIVSSNGASHIRMDERVTAKESAVRIGDASENGKYQLDSE